MKDLKKFVSGAAKILGGLAGLVFLRAPFTKTGWAPMGGSGTVGLICVGAYVRADADEDDEAEASNEDTTSDSTTLN